MARNLLYIMTWEEKMEAEGARRMVLALLEGRFGPVPEEVTARLEKIRSMDRLIRLACKAVDAKSLKSLRLG